MRKIFNPIAESNGSAMIPSSIPGQINRQKVELMRRQISDSLSINQPTIQLPFPTLERETHQQKTNMTIATNSGIQTPEQEGQNTPTKMDNKMWRKDMKNILAEKNPKYSEINDNQRIQDEKIQIIEIKFKCAVDLKSLINIIEEPLADHIIMHEIALAVNNKRRTQQLKTQIKKTINPSDDAKAQQVHIINQFQKNIDAVKNNNKIKSTPTQSTLKKVLPKVKGQQIHQLNNQIINNLSNQLHTEIHSILPMQSNKESQYIEITYLGNHTQPHQSEYNITQSSNITLELNPNNIPQGDDEQIIFKLPITLPENNPLIESQFPKQENILYARNIHPSQTYLLKLIQRVQCKEKDRLNLNIYISHRIAQDIYFTNLRDIIKNPSLFNTILQNLFEASIQIKVWCNTLKKVDDNEFSNFYITLLIPQNDEHHTQHKVKKKMTYVYKTGLEEEDIQINYIIIHNKIKSIINM
ncbi:hypothetical protein ABPG72_014018 [Tetrahymena utriculariae]